MLRATWCVLVIAAFVTCAPPAHADDLVPLKLYFNDRLGDNYTTATAAGERAALASGYRFIRIEGYVFRTEQPGTVPLKLYFSDARRDNYTTATPAGAQAAQNSGYRFIQIEGYVYPAQRPGTVPLKNYFSSQRGDNFTTATGEGERDAKNSGYQFVMVEGYILSSPPVPTVPVRLDGYPCGDDTARPQSQLSCDKRGFAVLLVGIVGDGTTSLPDGTSIWIEQSPQGGGWSPTPPDCTNPARAENCRLTVQPQNRGSVRAGFRGGQGTPMYYRATVRDRAGKILLTSDLVRVFWTNQESDVVDAGLRLEGYPCGDATAPPRTDLSCDKPGFTVLLVGILGNGATSLPAGMSLFFEQAPAGGSWAAQPPGCSSPPTAVNCRLTIQTSNRGSARAGFQGPTGTVMYYRVTLRNNTGIAQGVSNVIRVFWSNQASGPVPPGSTPPGSTPPGPAPPGPTPPGPTPPGPGIHVVSGTYGGNCGQPEGNVTQHLAASCNGRASCNYLVDHTVIGDPAFLCKKTYVAKWRCGGGTQIKEASVPAEATAKTVTLSCP